MTLPAKTDVSDDVFWRNHWSHHSIVMEGLHCTWGWQSCVGRLHSSQVMASLSTPSNSDLCLYMGRLQLLLIEPAQLLDEAARPRHTDINSVTKLRKRQSEPRHCCCTNCVQLGMATAANTKAQAWLQHLQAWCACRLIMLIPVSIESKLVGHIGSMPDANQAVRLQQFSCG